MSQDIEQNRSEQGAEVNPQQTAPDAGQSVEQGTGGAEEAEAGAGELQQLLEDARAKADDHWDQLLRTRAELENLRRRHDRELGNAHKFALEKFAAELLPVKDSLELGLAAIADDVQGVQQLRQGVELTLKMLATALEKFEIREVNPLDEPFNPDLHQAMSIQESDKAPNTVLAVMQKGYTLHGRLIRPAMVVVAKAASAEQGGGGRVDEQA